MKQTIAFSEQNKGWTGFYGWRASMFARLKNRFYSFKNGQLYIHNDENNPQRNNFYGEQFDSKIVTVFNDNPSDDKIFKTLVEEGTHPWKATLKTNLSNGTIDSKEFNQKESRWFAYTRGNEDTTSISGTTSQGIGVIQIVDGTNISFNGIPNSVSIGDTLYQLNNTDQETIGVITAIDPINKIITVAAIETIPVAGYFSFSIKNRRVNGGDIRGYYLEVTLENSDTENVELFGISTNAVKSDL